MRALSPAAATEVLDDVRDSRQIGGPTAGRPDPDRSWAQTPLRRRARPRRGALTIAAMNVLLAGHDATCDLVIWLLLRLALAVDDWRRSMKKRVARLRGSIRRLLRRFRHAPDCRTYRRRRRAHNRTSDDAERDVVRLHVEQPQLGARQLRDLVRRALGVTVSPSTVRRIVLRNRDAIVGMENEKRKAPRKIAVNRACELWGADTTLLWVLGFFPVWVLGVVDYHGSRMLALEPLAWPSASEIVAVMSTAFARYGVPERVLTDRGSVFRSELFESMLAGRGVKHTLTRPCHPWTNGRIERVFRTLKETIGNYFWLLRSRGHVERVCRDFVLFYNAHRPHSSFGGRTPDEVHAGSDACAGHFGRLALFDGRFMWWRLS